MHDYEWTVDNSEKCLIKNGNTNSPIYSISWITFVRLNVYAHKRTDAYANDWKTIVAESLKLKYTNILFVWRQLKCNAIDMRI